MSVIWIGAHFRPDRFQLNSFKFKPINLQKKQQKLKKIRVENFVQIYFYWSFWLSRIDYQTVYSYIKQDPKHFFDFYLFIKGSLYACTRSSYRFCCNLLWRRKWFQNDPPVFPCPRLQTEKWTLILGG